MLFFTLFFQHFCLSILFRMKARIAKHDIQRHNWISRDGGAHDLLSLLNQQSQIERRMAEIAIEKIYREK